MYEVKPGNNPENAREKNIALILQHLLKYNVMSRLQLSKATGLTQASITYIVKILIDWQVVEETGALQGSSKRPEIGLKLSDKKFAVVSVRFNEETIYAELFTLDGHAVCSLTSDFNKEMSVEGILNVLHLSIKALIEKGENKKIIGIGIALNTDYLTNISYHLENKFADVLSSDFNVPVVLEYEANCGALAEMCFGEELYDRDLIFLNINRRVNAGIICDGRLYKSKSGKAGSLGHTTIDFNGPICSCGNKGCLDFYCNSEKIALDYFNLTGKKLSPLEVLKLVENGDKQATHILKDVAGYLSIGLVNLINIINPGTIVLSDYVSVAGKIFIDFVKDGIKERVFSEVYNNLNMRMSSALTTEMIQKGAAMAVVIRLLKEPTKHFSC